MNTKLIAHHPKEHSITFDAKRHVLHVGSERHSLDSLYPDQQKKTFARDMVSAANFLVHHRASQLKNSLLTAACLAPLKSLPHPEAHKDPENLSQLLFDVYERKEFFESNGLWSFDDTEPTAFTLPMVCALNSAYAAWADLHIKDSIILRSVAHHISGPYCPEGSSFTISQLELGTMLAYLLARAGKTRLRFVKIAKDLIRTGRFSHYQTLEGHETLIPALMIMLAGSIKAELMSSAREPFLNDNLIHIFSVMINTWRKDTAEYPLEQEPEDTALGFMSRAIRSSEFLLGLYRQNILPAASREGFVHYMEQFLYYPEHRSMAEELLAEAGIFFWGEDTIR